MILQQLQFNAFYMFNNFLCEYIVSNCVDLSCGYLESARGVWSRLSGTYTVVGSRT